MVPPAVEFSMCMQCKSLPKSSHTKLKRAPEGVVYHDNIIHCSNGCNKPSTSTVEQTMCRICRYTSRQQPTRMGACWQKLLLCSPFFASQCNESQQRIMFWCAAVPSVHLPLHIEIFAVRVCAWGTHALPWMLPITDPSIKCHSTEKTDEWEITPVNNVAVWRIYSEYLFRPSNPSA